MTDVQLAVLTCPEPDACPVVDILPAWDEVTVLDGDPWYRGYDLTWGYDEFNPGFGDARFSPIEGADGSRVPSLYLAANPTAALLESVFHSIDASSLAADRLGRPTFPQKRLADYALACVSSPSPARVADLRDEALERMELERSQLITSPAEHYPCTRRLATDIHADERQVAGIIWHSRQTEITGHGQVETLVIFGDRHPADRHRGQWGRPAPGVETLTYGPGRDLADRIADALGFDIE